MVKRKIKRQIIHRHTGQVLFESEGTISEVIKKAIKEDADLRYATFRLVDGFTWELDSIDWKGKDLEGIDLRYVKAHNQNFKGCNLSKATLCRSDFTGSSFEGADFTETMITPAKVDGCDFKDANLSQAKSDFTDFTKAKRGAP